MDTKLKLEADVASAAKSLSDATSALAAFNQSAENNTFDTLDEALDVIADALGDRAREDCEGSHNCGNESYEQEFIAGGVRYIGKLKCEYGRHDKTYYFLDGKTFTCSVVEKLSC